MQSMLRVSLSVSILAMTAVSGCSPVPKEAYMNRGGPESLLDASSERVSVQLTGPSAIDELITWLNEDQPTSIELGCADEDPYCQEAIAVAEQFAVPATYSDVMDNSVTLVYERIIARDCSASFVNNTVNPYNLHHPSFGCSIAANALQMISDKQQIVAPSLMDYQDGEKAASALSVYTEERPVSEKFDYEDVFEFRGGDDGGGGM